MDTLIEPLSASEPAVVGRFRILGVLGAGGMGRVLLGVGPDGRFVAVKQIHAHLVGDPEFRARFEREIRVSMRVSGAFTAALIDFELTGPTPWLASVFIPGVPLDSAIRSAGPLPVSSLRTLASGLASALHSIHGTGLIHRDLKPANVIIAADGPRVIDFGIAHTAEAGGIRTEAGAVVGSPAYMSPEQANGEQLTAASDIFAFGGLLYMAATGASPFAATSAPLTLFNVVHTEPNLDRLPPELRGLIAACLSKDPRRRPTPSQILDHLGVLPVQASPWTAAIDTEIRSRTAQLAAYTADPDATRIIPSARPEIVDRKPPKRRRAGWVAAASVCVIALAAAATLVLTRGSETPAAPPDVEPVAFPTLEQVRGTDTCAWLRQSLGDNLPAEVVGGTNMNIGAWNWQPTSTWGCSGVSVIGSVIIEIGAAMDGFTATERKIAGRPLLHRGAGCAVGLDNGDQAARWGFTVESSATDDCVLSEYILERLANSMVSLPRDPADGRTLSALDPCALVGQPNSKILTAAGPAKLVGAHGCEWDGDGHLRVTLSQPRRTDFGFQHQAIDLGDGVTALSPSAVDSIGARNACSRQYLFRTIADSHVEIISVEVSDPYRISEQICPTAEAAVKGIVGRLPAL
ncbi:serine/threonine-protein kinase [Nocardia salmonicida]|uniref:serine/threonine-protein kinase n=1 Tax=Nocardia salmonicida TaxID=53431 RepID=UPI0007A51E77|nr:serine/threonine-protein kinase [Nocardia salmonicida]